MAEDLPLDHQPLFADPHAVAALPTPVAAPLQVMLSEIAVSGEETTADETAAAIEAVVRWLGRLWVAEYLAAIGEDGRCASDDLNRDLRERLASDRPTLTGQWVGIWRRARAALGARTTIVRGLAAADPGERDDGGPIDRLVRFRNHFSHGSFASTVSEIRAHRTLLHDLLQSVPGLWEQPVLCLDPDTGVVLEARGAWHESSADPSRLAAGHPTILGGDRALDLYPLLAVRLAGGARELVTPGEHLSPATLLDHPALCVWFERYDRERLGHLAYDAPGSAEQVPTGVASALREALGGARSRLVLVEAHPGTGIASVGHALAPSDPLDLGLARFAAMRCVAVRPGLLGQSGSTVAHVVLRAVEQALSEAEGTRGAAVLDRAGARAAIEAAARDLEAAGARVLLGLDGLHDGQHAYRGEALTVLDVYALLANTPVAVVATTVPGGLDRPIFDHRIHVPVPASPSVQEVQASLHGLAPPGSLNERVLRVLATAEGELHLFQICDGLEAASGDTVFEPRVERALWDLRPLLTWRRDTVEVEPGLTERARVWRPFHPDLASWLTRGAA